MNNLKEFGDGEPPAFDANAFIALEVLTPAIIEELKMGINGYLKLNKSFMYYARSNPRMAQYFGAVIQKYDSVVRKLERELSPEENMDDIREMIAALMNGTPEDVIRKTEKGLESNAGNLRALSDYHDASQKLINDSYPDELQALDTLGLFSGRSSINLKKLIRGNEIEMAKELLQSIYKMIINPVGKIYNSEFEDLERFVGGDYVSRSIKEKRILLPHEYVTENALRLDIIKKLGFDIFTNNMVYLTDASSLDGKTVVRVKTEYAETRFDGREYFLIFKVYSDVYTDEQLKAMGVKSEYSHKELISALVKCHSSAS